MNSLRSQMRFDRNIILKIMALLVILIALSIPLFPNLAYATIYVGFFLGIGILYFSFSIQWISTLTIFYASAFISLGPGIYFIVLEHTVMQYNPYIIVLPGMGMILAGYIFGSIRFFKKGKIKRFHGKVSWKISLYGTYMLSTVAWMIYYFRFRGLLNGNLENGRIEAMSGAGALVFIAQLHIMTIVLMFIETKKKYISKLVFWPLCIFGLIQLLSMGFRSPATICVICILIVQILDGKIQFRTTIPIVCVIFSLAIFYGIYRSGTSGLKLYYVLRAQLYNPMYNLDLMYRYFPSHVGFQHGYTYLINLIMLLPGPGQDFTLWLKDAIDFTFSGGGITPTVFGEFYINFGTAGIFICSFLLGIWFRKLDNWIYSGNVDFWRAYTLILVPSCLGGGIANIMIQPLIFGIYYLFLSIISYPHHTTISTNVNREFHSKGEKIHGL